MSELPRSPNDDAGLTGASEGAAPKEGGLPVQPIELQFEEAFLEGVGKAEVKAISNGSRELQQALLNPVPPDDPEAFARYCREVFAVACANKNLSLQNAVDPQGRRHFINELVKCDLHVALGAIADVVEAEYQLGSNDVPETHRRTVLNLTHNLCSLLHEMCQGATSTLGYARLRTILRYMLEPSYKQNVKAAEVICSTTDEKYIDQSDREVNFHIEEAKVQLAFDLGCGPGATLDVLGQRAERVIGVDSNPLYAMRKKDVHVGVIDFPQKRLSLTLGGKVEPLSLEKYQGQADLVFASLVLDRVASQQEFFMTVKRLLKEGGIFALALLLPVRGTDDEPGLQERIQYVVEPLCMGQDAAVDRRLLIDHLKDGLGFSDVMFKQVDVQDPVSGNIYKNHHLCVALRG